MSAPPKLPDFSLLGEPELSFHPVSDGSRSTHPLRGICAFGPYSSEMRPTPLPRELRLAFITLDGGEGRDLRNHLNRLSAPHAARDRGGYFPDFAGFEPHFRLPLSVPQSRSDPCSLLSLDTVRGLMSGPDPEKKFMGLLMDALRDLASRRTEFEVIVFHFPPLMERIFRIRERGYEFDLHHATKALTATMGIPSQLVLRRSMDYTDQCSVMWSLATGLYTKAGGIPWRLATSPERLGTAYLGLAYVMRETESGSQVLTCCSQLFNDRGEGLQFLLYTTSDFIRQGRNPFLRRAEMRSLLTKSLELYINQSGALPRRVVVHKTTPFTREERQGAVEALQVLDDFELLQIQAQHPWNGVRGVGRKPAAFPVLRGTAMAISKFSYLLWTHGDAPGAGKDGRSYYQGHKGIPAPLLITQHAGRAPISESASEIVALTKMNWNTGRLYNLLPVTIKSATLLGRTAKYMQTVRSTPYEYRMFM